MDTVTYESLLPEMKLGWRKLVNGIPVSTIYLIEVLDTKTP